MNIVSRSSGRWSITLAVDRRVEYPPTVHRNPVAKMRIRDPDRGEFTEYMSAAAMMRETSTPALPRKTSAGGGPGLAPPARSARSDAILQEPLFIDIRNEIAAGRPLVAHFLLKGAGDPESPEVLWATAALASRSGDPAAAETHLRKALSLDPAFHQAAQALGTVLVNARRWHDALAHFGQMLDADPDDLEAGMWKAWVHAQIGEFDAAIAATRDLLGRAPADGRVLLSLANWLKAAGRSSESLDAYRAATRHPAARAGAWWGLANLKTVRFDESHVAEMRQSLSSEATAEGRVALHFALAKGLEDVGRYDRAFAQLQQGSAQYLARNRGRATDFVRDARQVTDIFTPGFVRQVGERGCRSTAPIFIVGMPRSGTTLLEQILDSHPQVEGLGELPYMDDLARSVTGRAGGHASAVHGLTGDDLQELARRYLDQVAVHRRTAKPYFVDKLPSNWIHLGIVHLVFPRATIIDSRRDPLDCCVANFRQYFPRGHEFTYSLEDLGSTYRAYTRLIDHFRGLIPDRLYIAIHEEFLEDSEGAIRALLREIGLPFSESCLTFFDNRRAVATPSAAQVRTPINRAGTGRWRNYEPWLGPLFAALGDSVRPSPAAVRQTRHD